MITNTNYYQFYEIISLILPSFVPSLKTQQTFKNGTSFSYRSFLRAQSAFVFKVPTACHSS